MKTEVRNEFILEAHKSACNEWKLKIEKECPELFKHKTGWYKDKNEENKVWLIYKDFENNIMYGFDANGDWYYAKFILEVNIENEYLASEEEVKEALIKEAKKRGFKEGIKFKSVKRVLHGGEITKSIEKTFIRPIFVHYPSHNETSVLNNGTDAIFYNGNWAEIISNPIEEKIKNLQKQLDELKKQL